MLVAQFRGEFRESDVLLRGGRGGIKDAGEGRYLVNFR